MQQNERKKKKGDQGFKTIHTTKAYQRLGWSLHPLSSSTSRPSAFALGIQRLNHLQRESHVHLPVVGLMVLISATRTLSGSPWSTRLHPRGTAVVMVTQPITVAEGGAGSTGCHRWLFQSWVETRLGPSLFLLVTDLDPDPRRWHMQVWGYVWFLIVASSDRVVECRFGICSWTASCCCSHLWRGASGAAAGGQPCKIHKKTHSCLNWGTLTHTWLWSALKAKEHIMWWFYYLFPFKLASNHLENQSVPIWVWIRYCWDPFDQSAWSVDIRRWGLQ